MKFLDMVMNQENYLAEIKAEIAANRIVLFAKGSKEQPYCGFSAAVISILNSYGVPFAVVDVLTDPQKKEVLKEYSQWPTIPQLYINGELVGGCDITKELHQSGELKKLLEETVSH